MGVRTNTTITTIPANTSITTTATTTTTATKVINPCITNLPYWQLTRQNLCHRCSLWFRSHAKNVFEKRIVAFYKKMRVQAKPGSSNNIQSVGPEKSESTTTKRSNVQLSEQVWNFEDKQKKRSTDRLAFKMRFLKNIFKNGFFSLRIFMWHIHWNSMQRRIYRD